MKLIRRIVRGGGTCYYAVITKAGKLRIRGPFRKEIAKQKVEEINRTSATTGERAKSMGAWRSPGRTENPL